MNILKKITNEWSNEWIVAWFVSGVAIVSWIFWATTSRSAWDIFYLLVSIVGFICVVALSFRKSVIGNGLGIVANIGEIVTQAHKGATGLLLAPIFYMCSHFFGLRYWSKNSDGNGNMIPQSANKFVWLVAVAFIAVGLRPLHKTIIVLSLSCMKCFFK